MKVLRVELWDGRGPYQYCGGGYVSAQQPLPEADGLKESAVGSLVLACAQDDARVLFAFKHHDQLCAWWGVQDLCELRKTCPRPLYVTEYEVTEWCEGGHQVIFCDRSATVRSRVRVEDFVVQEGG